MFIVYLIETIISLKGAENMLKGDLPESKLVKGMIDLPTPDHDTVYYPARLAFLGTRGKYAAFMTMSQKTGRAFIIITQPDRVRFRLGGSPLFIANIYDEIPWKEKELIDENGVFSYKEAPSLQVLEDYFKAFDK